MSRVRLGLGLLSLVAGLAVGWLAGLLRMPRATNVRDVQAPQARS